MPDGGAGNCGNCTHFDPDERQCTLRDVPIKAPFWTTCHNFNSPSSKLDGPIYAIVGIVKDGAGGYRQLPYLNGNRPDTKQKGSPGDTVVYVTEDDGTYHEFETVDEYLQFHSRMETE